MIRSMLHYREFWTYLGKIIAWVRRSLISISGGKRFAVRRRTISSTGIAGDATAINYNLWPWVGRASETLQNHGFQQAISEGVFWPGAIVRAGLYARVSTHDQQTLPLQLAAMRDYVSKRGWKAILEVQDIGSGASLRPKREELLKAARRRELDRIVVWRLDRWGRSLLESSFHPGRAGISECRLRLVERSTRSNNAQRPSSRRNAGDLCGLCGVHNYAKSLVRSGTLACI